MAKENKNEQKITLDEELLTHKYANHYRQNALSDSENDENFVYYATKMVFYPVYRAKIHYQITKERPLHPVIEQILKIVKKLQILKNINTEEKLLQITQLDDEIYEGILGDLFIEGLLTSEDNAIKLSQKGEKLLNDQKELIRTNTSAFVLVDGVFNNILEKNKETLKLDKNKPSEEDIELQPKFKARPRTEELYNEFNQNKTLYQVLYEGLEGLDQDSEINDIDEVSDTRKFFKKYLCLFYKNAVDKQKILVIDEASYVIDNDATKRFDKLLSEQGFEAIVANPKKNEAFKELRAEFHALTEEKITALTSGKLDLSEGRRIKVYEHKDYFLYVLNNAKKHICIQSPWVSKLVIQNYHMQIKAALERGVQIYVKYGIGSPNDKNEKPIIDDIAQMYFKGLAMKFKGLFHTKVDNSHEKYLICDDEFAIVGSFNWLSFLGEQWGNKELRGESSHVIKNKESIADYLREFGLAE